MSPQILDYKGIKVCIPSGDHEPVHVHAYYSGQEYGVKAELYFSNKKNMIIKSAKYIRNYTIGLTFHNGKVKVIDMKDFLFDDAHLNFSEYRNKNKFKKFRIEYYGLAWGNNHVDLSADHLYNWERYERIENKRSKEKIIAEVEF